MRKRHKTRYPGIYYRLVDETKPDGARRYIVWYEDANGDGHTETQPLGSGLEDARLRQSQLKTKKAQGDRIIPTKVTVAELLDEWLEGRRGSLDATTATPYEWAIRVHLKQHIGRRKVSELSAEDVAAMIAALKKAGMATTSVEKVLTPLRGALKLAMRRGWITTNPVSLLFSHERAKPDQKEKRILARDDIPRLLAAASSERWRALFALLTFTGLRISEALALTWDDISFADRTLSVRESKTPAGVRKVMVIPSLGRLLAQWSLMTGGREGALVFPVSYKSAQRALYAAEKRAGLEQLTPHELRHTFASILIGQGELPTFVARQMGHADPSITLKVYAHLWEEQESVEKATGRLEAAFGGLV